jgi:uncharacterized membrane protein (Fun14 family)
MSIPPELAWLVPIVVPFIIGLLVGAVIKRTFKLMVIIAALVIVLVATGALSLSFSDLYEKATELLPRIAEKTEVLKNILPYASAAFLIGLALGLWKG